MQIPILSGVIDRRILVNYRVDAFVMAKVLPEPFRPKLIGGFAMGGICLIRLKKIRPRFFPFEWGLGSENAAHRIAVEWDVNGETREGVYVPRRDTSSRLNVWAGGTLFPGIHHHASFLVEESDEKFLVTMQSDDKKSRVHVSGEVTDALPESSIFSSVGEVSAFFERGSVGYSDSSTEGRFDGIELQCDDWKVEPLSVDQVESSYFEEESLFPAGSVCFDNALLMRGIEHEWHGRNMLCCPGTAE